MQMAAFWSAPARGNSGQASVEALLTAIALLAIVVVPVTFNNENLLGLLEQLIQTWMFVFTATWQHFLLHPWAS